VPPAKRIKSLSKKFMSKVNIVYTNGAESYKVYWVSQHKNDIYHGFYLKGHNLHQSHHRDGKVHIKKNGDKLSLYKSVPISEIKDYYHLTSFNAGELDYWGRKYYAPYKSEKLKNIVWIDTRLFSNNQQTQVELGLLKPEFICILASRRFRKIEDKDYRLIQIIQDSNPWLIVHVRNLKYLHSSEDGR
jgi:hypothetical protein